jgi:hypothetical protein
MTTVVAFGPLFCAALFVATLVLLEAGRRIGAARLAADPDGAMAGVGAVDAAVFALLGLLIAFTFSGAASRFDARRQLIVEETNRIGTAWLRIDLLPASEQPHVRMLFRSYVDSRLATYRTPADGAAQATELARSTELQQALWQHIAKVSRESGSHPTAALLLLPALNEMFDIRSTRIMATLIHPPAIVFAMLAALTLTAAMLVGYDMARGRSRSWMHIVGFAAAMTLTVYVIIDLEYPRLGFIRVDAADRMLLELRQTMQ